MSMKSFGRQFNSVSKYPLNRVGLCCWKTNNVNYRITARSTCWHLEKVYLGSWVIVKSVSYCDSNPDLIKEVLSEYMFQ